MENKKFLITINGKKIQAEENMTILEAAARNGIHIPTLCYMKGIHEVGACRVCVVKVKGSSALQPACVTKVSENMEIETNTEDVISARKTIVNLLLSNGRHNCISCEASGECRLQQIAYSLGIEEPEFYLESVEPPAIDASSEMIIRDNGKCVLCRRCITACNSIVCNDVLDISNRGVQSVIICDNNKPMGESSCVQCGHCVQVCPVGALIDKKSKGRARTWEVKKVRTTCPYCGVGCQMYLHMKGEQIVRVTGVDNALPNKGRLCVKGRYGYDFIYSEDRLTKPLIKENGEFREATWDEALDLVAAKFRETIEKYGPDSVAGISSARSHNEDSYYMQKLFRAVYKSPNIDNCARSCHAPTVAGLITSFGTGGMTNSIGEFANTKLLICIGTNMTEAHPVAATFVKNGARNGAKLIVIDPRRHRLTDYADKYVQLKVGTDVALINGLSYVIIKEGLYDKDFVNNHCENFEEFKEEVMKYPPERTSEITGVPVEDIIETARMMGQIKPAMLIYSLGITEHTSGKKNVMSLANLQMLLGNIGRKNSGINPLRGQNNVQGACDMGALPDYLPGYQKLSDPAAREKFARAWGVDSIPSHKGITIPEMIEGLYTKRIRALHIFGQNIVGSEPNIRRIEECLKSADFLVVNDIFHNETTRFAHVVLPSAAWGEDDGTFTNAERRVSRVRKVKNPPGEAKPDWWIFKEIARRFGQDWPSNSSREIWDNEFTELVPNFKGLKYYRIENDGIQWPCPDENHPGTQILHKDGNFTHGKGKFQAVSYTPQEEITDEEYPFVLSTGRRLYHYHTRTQTGRCQGLNELLPEEYADISVEDAERLGICDGEKVRVKSRRGEVIVTARVSDRIQPGLVWMAFHFRENNANWLTNMAYDPETQTAEYKACAVRIEKIEDR